ncbi:MAG: pilus assembly protein [Mesorhizobium sp.]|nr:pilus assembly protein [bacterium M00.F.Ca.ET.205.01.1.1]TGU51054.1 pilus assembly protein [bacterium M00.F.Ca.ET.152.01.1.1]TGV34549.1 pilus assembly protein [Mesorhizobium sp. M00.F.Ca.ET.186.01.1.1]TGZ42155.1 pilus assembly protein [bacterium M00.F.Ca.ET.162.01.1.1]TIW62645.1 MAG: pilus assembly protein [Mesorhizobium sp.]
MFCENLYKFQENSGTSAVEFALLSPLFMLLLLGMVAYGIYFGAANSIQQIAADAARTAIAGLNQTERQTLVASFVTNNAGGYAFVDASKLTYQANDSTADGSQFVVSIQYDARNLPIWNLFPGITMPGTTITRQSTIRVGGI